MPVYKNYSTNGKTYKQEWATSQVMKALREGTLIRPEHCEICGDAPKPDRARVKIHGHHWNGYDNPTDVWWLCISCNLSLRGRRFHIGQVTISEAREYIEAKRKERGLNL